jgi:dipeptidyl aminopeptidase/acylaminoacyl peptidase
MTSFAPPAARRRRAALLASTALFTPALVVASTALFTPALVVAQSGYKQPPAVIAQILDAEQTPLVTQSPDRRWLLQLRRRGLPSIAEVSAPELRLAGMRLNPRTNGGSRDAAFSGLTFQSVDGGATRDVTLPGSADDARIGAPMWSADGRRIAFTITSPTGITLWTADVPEAAAGPAVAARQLADVGLNATTGSPCSWVTPAQLACLTVPASRGQAPVASEAPDGPIDQESTGKPTPNPTFQDLLRSPADVALFEHYVTSQVALVGVDGRVTRIGTPELRTRLSPSPDGRWLLVETAHRPFSYLVPLGAFPARTEVWDLTGRVAKLVDDSPLDEQVSRRFDQVAPGTRDVNWRADAPATLVWAEALDGGDPAAQATKRDAVRLLPAPFTGAPTTLAQLDWRAGGLVWARPDLAFVTESWRRTRTTRTWAIDPSAPSKPARLVWERSSEDRYANPGSFEMAPNQYGRNVLLTSKDRRFAYLNGQGASAEGDRPFLDRFEIATGKTARLFQSQAPHYESVVALLDADGSRILTRRESKTEVPNYWRRDLVRRIAPVQLTQFKDPAPQFAGVTSELVRYKRKDGVDLSATVYLPAGYDKANDGPLPFLLWAYPREFGSTDAASQVQGSPYRFTRPSGASHLFALLQGYGVMDDPAMPIVAMNGKESNDTYVEQLVTSAEAAVEKIVAMGVGDRERVGVGGHSYGAFMTANLLSHTKLFKAGIARSGAYNRTLTPFGFQGEERDYWKAQELYTEMSPFTYANRVTTPILLIHGMADDNTGTFPVQSERYYAALKGNGAKARYVQLPAEAHGYRARESVGHTLWEMVNWLDTYVKPAASKRME